MLRRPPTTLTLGPTDIAAYEVSRTKRLAQASREAKQRQKQKLKEKRKQEQLSPMKDGRQQQDARAPSKQRLTDAPARRAAGSEDTGRQAHGRGGYLPTGRPGGAPPVQRQTQAQRIYGREAGSVGPIIDEDEENEDDDDDDDLDVTLPTAGDIAMRGGDARAALFRQPHPGSSQNQGIQSDTETNTESGDEDAAMDTEPTNLHYHQRRDHDDDEGGSRIGPMTIQSRMGVGDTRATGARHQSSSSNHQSTSSRGTNSRTRPALPQTGESTAEPPAQSDPASKSSSLASTTTRKAEDASVDSRNKRQASAVLPRRQWVV